MNAKTIEEVFRRLAAANPNPRGELEFINPYTLLVAVALSAQATDASVNKATRELFKVAKTPAEMLKLGEAGLKPYIQTIGLYNTKAKNVIRAAEILIAEHGGVVPKDAAALEKLPGVGAKTAKVVLNVAFGVPVIAVDTHIFRLANRLGMVKTKAPDETMKRLEAIVPEKYRLNAHHWLILHGRYICVARKPRCPDCILNDLCAFKEKTLAEGQPIKLKAPAKPKAKVADKAKLKIAAKPKHPTRPRGRATV
jgi:endonuclease-3